MSRSTLIDPPHKDILLDEGEHEPSQAPAPVKRDIYLALSGGISLQLTGYLVTEAGDVDRVIAYCPVTPTDPSHMRQLMARQLRNARRVARGLMEKDEDNLEVLWLRHPNGPLPMPPWVYGLTCIPLSGKWDGEFRHPCPFSSAMMERMARQPEAMRWLRRQ
jgi:hypothetical protein